MRELGVHETCLLLLEGESRHGVINISVDHMVLLKGTWLVAYYEPSASLWCRRHPHELLTTHCLLRAHRFILSLMQLNNFVQTVIEICDLNSALRLIIRIQWRYQILCIHIIHILQLRGLQIESASIMKRRDHCSSFGHFILLKLETQSGV
jgi:hypothetical protein